MSAVPDIHVAPVSPDLADAVRALRVAPGQYAHVGDVSFNLANAEADPNSEAMAILAGDVVIGFYRLDYRPTAVSWKPLLGASVVLRAFLLDRAWQGRGLSVPGILACCADLARRRPACRLLALNVDCCNVAAIRAYRQAGFVDTGELHFGGSAGPQRLMLRGL